MAVDQTEQPRAPVEEPADPVCPWCRGSVEETWRRDMAGFGLIWLQRTYHCWQCNVDIRVDTPPAKPLLDPR